MPVDAETLFCAAVPPRVRRELAGAVDLDEEIRLAVATDIKLDGQYGEAWLLATGDQLVAFSPDGRGSPTIVRLPLGEINGVEVREDWGTAALKVRTGKKGATMAVFSKSLVPALSELPGRLEKLVEEARPAAAAGQLLKGRLAGRAAGASAATAAVRSFRATTASARPAWKRASCCSGCWATPGRTGRRSPRACCSWRPAPPSV